MFKLHGSPMSNYYNIVKLSLLEKGLDFEEVFTPPSQNDEFFAMSPMGKIPVLETKEGFLSESEVIVDFLEDVHRERPLYPTDPFRKAEARRIAHFAAISIDLPLRPLIAMIFSGSEISDDIKASTKAQLERGLNGFARAAKPSPWLAGADFGAADIFAYYCLGMAAQIAQMHLGVDVYSALPGLGTWHAAVAQREQVAQVDAAQKQALEAFFASQQG